MNRVNRFVRCAVVALVAFASTTALADVAEVPKEKQTTLGLYLTAQEAYDAWMADPESIKVLDVRSPDEYLFVGHTEMAMNIPFMVQTFAWDDAKKHFPMKPNPEFLAEVMKWAQPGDMIFVMCRSGTRSARAVNALAGAGFKNVYNVIDGMEGDLVEDPASPNHGKRLVNGWKNAGLPWTYEVDPANTRWPGGK